MKHLKNCAFGAVAMAVFGLAATQIPSQLVGTVNAAGSMDYFPANSRQSFLGKLDSGNVAGTSVVTIKTTMDGANDVFSTTSAQLVNGDEVVIGSDGYTVRSTSVKLKDSELALSEEISSAYAENTRIYGVQSGDIKITLSNLDTTVASGSLQFLFPATAEAALSNDGIPDSAGFDFGGATEAAIECPTGTTARYIPANSGATAITLAGAYYHAFYCDYNSALSSSTQTVTISGLINPAPALIDAETIINRNLGSMDVYSIKANQLDGNNAFVKSFGIQAGYGTAVKMTVRVMPQLTYKLEGITDTSNEACPGVTPTVTTDAFNVNFGSISNTNFTDAAQKMTITTNAAHGYVITAIANDQMGVEGNPCAGNGNRSDCIPGFNYDPSSTSTDAATHNTTTAAAWTEQSNPINGFGYTLARVSGDEYNNTEPNVQVAFSTDGTEGGAPSGATEGWRAFADRSASDDPIEIVNNQVSTNEDVINVCYRIRSSTANVAGEYRTALTYTITATF